MIEKQSPVRRCAIANERRRRIMIAVAAYAYEIEGSPLMSDAEYDRAAQQIDLTVRTGRDGLDDFFRDRFEPHTGLWVYQHPDLPGLARYAARIRRSAGRVIWQ